MLLISCHYQLSSQIDKEIDRSTNLYTYLYLNAYIHTFDSYDMTFDIWYIWYTCIYSSCNFGCWVVLRELSRFAQRNRGRPPRKEADRTGQSVGETWLEMMVEPSTNGDCQGFLKIFGGWTINTLGFHPFFDVSWEVSGGNQTWRAGKRHHWHSYAKLRCPVLHQLFAENQSFNVQMCCNTPKMWFN